MSEIKQSPGPWKKIENSWQYTTIYDANDNEICRLNLERFEDLNEDNQASYEEIQKADAEAIVRAGNIDAALRRAKAEVFMKLLGEYAVKCAKQVHAINPDGYVQFAIVAKDVLEVARAAQIEEGEDLK